MNFTYKLCSQITGKSSYLSVKSYSFAGICLKRYCWRTLRQVHGKGRHRVQRSQTSRNLFWQLHPKLCVLSLFSRTQLHIALHWYMSGFGVLMSRWAASSFPVDILIIISSYAHIHSRNSIWVKFSLFAVITQTSLSKVCVWVMLYV